MSTLSRAIEIVIKGNTYKATYPTVGQLMDIDILKLQMTNDKYDVMKFSYNASFQRRVLEAEAVATFNVLIPTLKADLTVKSMFDLSREEMDIVVKAYEDQFLPWFEEWNVEFTKVNNKVEEKA